MVDSTDAGVIRFTRVVNVTTLGVLDLAVDASIYNVTGTVMTCDQYDLREANRDPLEDLYGDCQCLYTISQQDNRVIDITGGVTQSYTVEFQEVVTRQCGDEDVGVVVHRDTLTSTQSIPPVSTLSYGFTFSAPGEYVDEITLRGYAFGSELALNVDFNPATVQATYPGLTLDPADFTYDGSNVSEMAIAYALVLNEAATEAYGLPVNSLTAVGSNNIVSIKTQLLHQPPEPYVITPRPGDADYNVVTTIAGGVVAFGSSTSGLITRTSIYSEECESINEEKTGLYLTWSSATPRDILPRLSPSITPRPEQSTITAFCDVSAAFCDAITPDQVTLVGCVDICSDVLNIGGQMPIAGIDTTLSAATYNSVSLYVTAGPVGIILNGVRINYPTGWSTLWSAQGGKLLQNSIRIDATDAEAIITYVQ
jgi:hypothetical protein